MATGLNPTQLLAAAADIVHLSQRPPPTAPTGYYEYEVTPSTDDDGQAHSKIANAINQAKSFTDKGGFKPTAAQIQSVWDLTRHPEAVNDRLGSLSTGLEILAKIDPNSSLAEEMGNSVIGMLYNTIPHPPASFLGPEHMFRKADGSGNNLENPDLGRAGQPYARSVQSKAGLPRTSLPDAGLIFDTVLRRQRQRNHPGGMSSLIFAYASIVTHSLFRTDLSNMHKNNASSYLDLSPLYGDNQADQDKVRDRAQGRGLLYPDTFSEDRLIFLPPASSALLVLYSRNHNYIAEQILRINERGRWLDPPPTDPDLRALQDEEIFQTARLINGGHFINSITGDYAAGFLGSAEGCNWNMKPFDRIETKQISVPRGQGNQCSVEFNILYRWHPTISAKDEKWTEELFSTALKHKPISSLTMQDLNQLGAMVASVPADPKIRTFSTLQRGLDGRFSDLDLFNILADATESPASSFGGQNSPGVLRLIEMLGIEQARAWGVCTMNEFRQFIGLKQFESFEEWNSDPAIASAARRLYGHISNLELYTGLVAEESMPLSDGLRFACGYTTTRAVLGDAIALVRGDRFYTSDFTPGNLTTWGFHDCQRDMNNGAGGAMIPKLLLRHLPLHYTWNSVYSLWPFFTPQKMAESLGRQGIANKYTFERPAPQPQPIILTNFTAISAVWNDPQRFKNIYPKIGYGSPLLFDERPKHNADRALSLQAIFPDKAALTTISLWMAELAKDFIAKKSWTYPGVPGKYVDIFSDVISPVTIQLVCDRYLGLSVKTDKDPSGLFTYRELYTMLTTLFNGNLLNMDDPVNAFATSEASLQYGKILGALTLKELIHAHPATSPNIVGSLLSRSLSMIWPPTEKLCYPFLSTLASTGRPADQLIGLTLALVVGSSVNLSQAAINVVDFYLEESRATEYTQIAKLVNVNDKKSTDLLYGYVREALRLSPQTPGLWRQAAVDATISQGQGLPDIHVKAGDKIWGNFRRAHQDPSDFPNPDCVDPTRPASSYHSNGAGFHDCIGIAFSQMAMVELVKVIFKLPNLRRAPGPAGQLNRVIQVVNETDTDFFVQRNGTLSRWPTSMQVVYDG